MMYNNNRRSITSGLSGAIVLLGLILAFAFGSFNLAIFFVALAFAILVGTFGRNNVNAIYGGIIGAMWMLILALFFATNQYWDQAWLLFLVGALLSSILGTLRRPIIAAIIGTGILGATSTQQPQQPYQPYTPPQAYQPQQPQTYQEGGQQYPYPPYSSTPPTQHEQQPQAYYPEQMPPKQ